MLTASGEPVVAANTNQLISYFRRSMSVLVALACAVIGPCDNTQAKSTSPTGLATSTLAAQRAVLDARFARGSERLKSKQIPHEQKLAQWPNWPNWFNGWGNWRNW